MEEWKYIDGLDNKYQISSFGRVKSDRKIFSENSSGKRYIIYNLRKDNKKVYFLAHRLVAIHFIPNPLNKPCVNHIDGNRYNNSVENLEWVTNSENDIHAFKNNLRKSFKGETHSNSKLTDIQRIEIRQYNNGLNNKQLADKYGVSSSLIGMIKSGKRFAI